MSSVQSLTLSESISRFLSLQESRALAYNKFHTGFKAFLESREENDYVELCNTIKTEFSAISKQINEVEAHLISTSHSEVASLIRVVQNNEREKLQLTIEQQLLKKTHIIDNEEEYDPMYERRTKEIAKSLSEIIDNINDALEEIRQSKDEE